MAPGQDSSTQQYRLLGGVVCFPSHWSVLEKLGQDLPTIHDPVPRWRYGSRVCEVKINKGSTFLFGPGRVCFLGGLPTIHNPVPLGGIGSRVFISPL